MVRADFLTGLFLILLSLYVLFESWRMPRLEHLQVHPLSVPGVVPAFLAVILILSGGVLVIRSVRAGGHRIGLTRHAVREVLGRPENRRLLITAGLTIGYAGFLVGSIPYWLGTGVFVFLFVMVFEWEGGRSSSGIVRLALVASALAVATTAAVTWVFERLFLVRLP
jgi:putative tricarboxylic transport membrane protein